MSLDLSSPRSLLPFSPLVPVQDSAAPPAPPSQQRSTGRPAIALKLTEHVLAQIQALLRSIPHGQQPEKGAIRIDLGVNPCLIINSISYPLRLDAEASHHSILRQRPQAEHQGQLEPIATIQHKATVKPGTEGLEKVGNSLRENRELAEKEREGRRAVLLDSAPLSRSSSLSRSISTSTTKRAPSPITTSSRTSSPAPPRPPSRLTAVPVKPPPSARIPPAVKAPTSSFRIGKGTVPASLSRNGSRSTSPTRSGSASESPILPPTSIPAPTPSTSTAEPVPTSATTTTSKVTSPAAVESASPADSSASTGSSSHVQSSSTGRTSLSSAGGVSPKAGGSSTLGSMEEVVGRKEPVKAGGGGVMKGKESLKKEGKAKAGSAVGDKEKEKEKARASPSPTKKDTSALPSSTISASSKKSSTPTTTSAPTTTSKRRDDPTPPSSTDINKKKRKLFSGADSIAPSDRSPSPALAPTVAVKERESSKAPTPISSPRISSLPSIKKKVGTGVTKKDKEKDKDKGKKRKVRAERWYSSSSSDEDGGAGGRDEDADAEGEPDLDLELSSTLTGQQNEADLRRASKRRRTVSAPDGPGNGLPFDPPGVGVGSAARGRATIRLAAPHLQTDSRSKTSSPLRTSSIVAPPHSPPPPPSSRSITLAPSTSINDYNKMYKTYASLHHLLMEERAALERGEDGDWTREELKRMVEKCSRLRKGLEGIK